MLTNTSVHIFLSLCLCVFACVCEHTVFFVGVCIHMYIQYVRVCSCVQSMHVFECVCVCVCVCVFLCVCVCGCVCVMCVCVWVCVCFVCVCVYVCVSSYVDLTGYSAVMGTLFRDPKVGEPDRRGISPHQNWCGPLD